MNKHFLTLMDYTPNEIRGLLTEAQNYKANRDAYRKNAPLHGKTLIMIFQKRSTRTRITTELAMTELGGYSLFLGVDDIHLGVNESLRDTASFLGRIGSAVLARVFDHADLDELAKYTGIPVINALSNKCHPLQALADLLTIKTHFPTLSKVKVAWVGDGNNVCQSIMVGCAKMGIDLTVASPRGYEPLEEVTSYCQKNTSTRITITNDPLEAVSAADVVVTDTFISMGQENEKPTKLEQFKGFTVDQKLVNHANPHYIFMHCLPRHQDEVTDDIFYSPHSVVFEEAENRLYTIAAVLQLLL